mmetsp:Transcript_10726/g.30456  ORF Transcript_10726/g.30456 Transcript_10726/m.30456 type:complete len:257 (+) Transcript_10726:120-890(+)
MPTLRLNSSTVTARPPRAGWVRFLQPCWSLTARQRSWPGSSAYRWSPSARFSPSTGCPQPPTVSSLRQQCRSAMIKSGETSAARSSSTLTSRGPTGLLLTKPSRPCGTGQSLSTPSQQMPSAPRFATGVASRARTSPLQLLCPGSAAHTTATCLISRRRRSSGRPLSVACTSGPSTSTPSPCISRCPCRHPGSGGWPEPLQDSSSPACPASSACCCFPALTQETGSSAIRKGNQRLEPRRRTLSLNLARTGKNSIM